MNVQPTTIKTSKEAELLAMRAAAVYDASMMTLEVVGFGGSLGFVVVALDKLKEIEEAIIALPGVTSTRPLGRFNPPSWN